MRQLLVVGAIFCSASLASAQFLPVGGVPNPYLQQSQLLGYLPNGTPVVNPWAIYPNPYAAYRNPYGAFGVNSQTVSPYVWGNNFWAYQRAMYTTPGLNPYLGFNDAFASSQGLIQNAVVYNRPLQLEPGRFIPVGRGLNLNPVTGTVVNNFQGVAYTNEGPFFRLPNSGSMTPWGSYLPGSGVYVNPFTGSAYNPATGLIVR